MKKYLPLLLAFIFISGCTNLASKNQNNSNSAENETLPFLEISVQADKSAYRSYEKINLSLNIISDRDLTNVQIEALGISTDTGRNYFQERQNIDLKKQSTKGLTMSQTLPACNSCSGLKPGDYSITIKASYQGKVLDTAIIDLSLSQ